MERDKIKGRNIYGENTGEGGSLLLTPSPYEFMVVIDEVMWNPAGDDISLGEYISIKNVSGEMIDLTHWRIKTASSSGTYYTRFKWDQDWSMMFCSCGDDMPLAYCMWNGDRYKITSSPDAIASHPGAKPCENLFSWNPYGSDCGDEFKLSNIGMDIVLQDANEQTVDHVRICGGSTEWCGFQTMGDATGHSAMQISPYNLTYPTTCMGGVDGVTNVCNGTFRPVKVSYNWQDSGIADPHSVLHGSADCPCKGCTWIQDQATCDSYGYGGGLEDAAMMLNGSDWPCCGVGMNSFKSGCYWLGSFGEDEWAVGMPAGTSPSGGICATGTGHFWDIAGIEHNFTDGCPANHWRIDTRPGDEQCPKNGCDGTDSCNEDGEYSSCCPCFEMDAFYDDRACCDTPCGYYIAGCYSGNMDMNNNGPGYAWPYGYNDCKYMDDANYKGYCQSCKRDRMCPDMGWGGNFPMPYTPACSGNGPWQDYPGSPIDSTLNGGHCWGMILWNDLPPEIEHHYWNCIPDFDGYVPYEAMVTMCDFIYSPWSCESASSYGNRGSCNVGKVASFLRDWGIVTGSENSTYDPGDGGGPASVLGDFYAGHNLPQVTTTTDGHFHNIQWTNYGQGEGIAIGVSDPLNFSNFHVHNIEGHKVQPSESEAYASHTHELS